MIYSSDKIYTRQRYNTTIATVTATTADAAAADVTATAALLCYYFIVDAINASMIYSEKQR